MKKISPSLITIVTVTYNAASTLEETILSVINQTYPNIEYIIIDGGSTDETLDIIKKYQDKISYWISEPDKGIYDAMNKGIDQATGNWINFMNAGDRFYNIDVLTTVFSKNCFTNVDILYGSAFYKSKFGYQLIQPLDISKMNEMMVFCHQSSFVRTEIIKDKRFDVKYEIAGDYNFFFQSYLKGYTFQEILLPISVYEVEIGISVDNMAKALKEECLIRQENFYSFKNMKRLIISKFKMFLKASLSENIGKYLKKQKSIGL